MIERSIHASWPVSSRSGAECVGLLGKYLEKLGCTRLLDVDIEVERLAYQARRCGLLAGDRGVGDVCDPTWGLQPLTVGDPCAPGLVCGHYRDSHLCLELVADLGEPCTAASFCPPGSACLDPKAEGAPTCRAPALEGKRCNPHDEGACSAGLLCDLRMRVCIDAVGQRCWGNDDCGTGMYCHYEENCQPVSDPVGTACRDSEECGDGYVCGPDGMCIVGPAAVCSTTERLDFCAYADDGLCDEPEGSGLCLEGTDPDDCV